MPLLQTIWNKLHSLLDFLSVYSKNRIKTSGALVTQSQIIVSKQSGINQWVMLTAIFKGKIFAIILATFYHYYRFLTISQLCNDTLELLCILLTTVNIICLLNDNFGLVFSPMLWKFISFSCFLVFILHRFHVYKHAV